MSFEDDNRDYETWLRAECKRVGCRAVEADLRYKHQRMKESAFVFLRATFFRWAKRIENLCPELAAAPAVLSVGDTHVENFGTWRDAEGRLVWGINDFDEAALIPYPFDLVRLATSIRLANGVRRCSTSRKPGCAIMWGSLTSSAGSSGMRSKVTRSPSRRRPRT
jgi:uncharacterized protein (DUF2252 family)